MGVAANIKYLHTYLKVEIDSYHNGRIKKSLKVPYLYNRIIFNLFSCRSREKKSSWIPKVEDSKLHLVNAFLQFLNRFETKKY